MYSTELSEEKQSLFFTLENEMSFSKRFSLTQLAIPVSLVDFDGMKLN